MEAIVHDTLALLRPLFCEPLRAKQRLAQGLGDEVFGRFRPKLDAAARARFDVSKAVLHDGYAVLVSQQFHGLFDPVRRREASTWQFDEFARADLLGVARRVLERCCAASPETPAPQRIEFALLPADPANRDAMVERFGLDGNACAPGWLLIELWPSAGNLARFEPALARLFALNLRWTNAAASAAPTLADHLAAHGLATNFLAELFATLPLPPWLVPFRPFEPWERVLSHVATLQNVSDYSELVTNTYGRGPKVGTARPAVVVPRDDEELDYARALLAPMLHATDPRTIAAALYGDELVTAQGHAAAGLSPYAGLEVAHERVREVLAEKKARVEDAWSWPSSAFFAAR